jgi:hypothetical protein
MDADEQALAAQSVTAAAAQRMESLIGFAIDRV